jgi:3-hydroxybutyryl-CoA dehydrogenase
MSESIVNSIAVVGSGAMGRGIGQLFAQAGCAIIMIDSNAAALAAAQAYFASTFSKMVEKGKLSQENANKLVSQIAYSESINAVKGVDLVIEAIVENLEVKRALFQQMEAIVPANTMLVSNTSSLSITSIAAACMAPARVAGLHFFNPVPLMKVVEIVRGALTDETTLQALVSLVKRSGHRGVLCEDTPGFIVNHAGRGYGLRALGEGVTTFAEIDAILREQVSFGGNGFKLGPFELLDLTGLDVSHPVMESIYHQYFEEPRFRPSVITKQRLDAKTLGRKTKRGFYDYQSGVQLLTVEDQRTNDLAKAAYQAATTQLPVWVAPSARSMNLDALVQALGANVETGSEPTAQAMILVAPWGTDASQEAAEHGYDASRVIAIDTLFAVGYQACKRRVIMATPATSTQVIESALSLFSADAAKVSLLADSAGFIAQRVCAMVVNIACDIAQQQVASPSDIDSAVQLGLGYPQGPLTMGDSIGAPALYQMLINLQGLTGDDRFRPSPWLRRRAQLNLSLLQDQSF